MKPAMKSVIVTALSTSFMNVTTGIENEVIVIAPPSRPNEIGKQHEERGHQQRRDDPRRHQETNRVQPPWS